MRGINLLHHSIDLYQFTGAELPHPTPTYRSKSLVPAEVLYSHIIGVLLDVDRWGKVLVLFFRPYWKFTASHIEQPLTRFFFFSSLSPGAVREMLLSADEVIKEFGLDMLILASVMKWLCYELWN